MSGPPTAGCKDCESTGYNSQDEDKVFSFTSLATTGDKTSISRTLDSSSRVSKLDIKIKKKVSILLAS